MKLLAALLLIGATSAPAFAGGPRLGYRGQRNVDYEEKCYKNVERYIPGYYDDFGNWKVGRVKTTRKRVPCSRLYERPRRPYYMPETTPNSFPRYEEEHPNMGNVVVVSRTAGICRDDFIVSDKFINKNTILTW